MFQTILGLKNSWHDCLWSSNTSGKPVEDVSLLCLYQLIDLLHACTAALYVHSPLQYFPHTRKNSCEVERPSRLVKSNVLLYTKYVKSCSACHNQASQICMHTHISSCYYIKDKLLICHIQYKTLLHVATPLCPRTTLLLAIL